MGIPCFVLSPRVFKLAPQGNIDLIKLGGVEFSNSMDIVKFFDKHSNHEFVTANGQTDPKLNDKKR